MAIEVKQAQQQIDNCHDDELEDLQKQMMDLKQLWKEIYPSDEDEGSKVDKDERSQEGEEGEEEEEEEKEEEEKFEQPGPSIKRFKELKEEQVGLKREIEEV